MAATVIRKRPVFDNSLVKSNTSSLGAVRLRAVKNAVADGDEPMKHAHGEGCRRGRRGEAGGRRGSIASISLEGEERQSWFPPSFP